MDCSWRRLPCGKEDCKVCGPISHLHFEHLNRGENHGSLEDTERIITKAVKSINVAWSTEEPQIEDFPIVIMISNWRDSVFSLISNSSAWEKGWIDSEAVADLTWYAGVLCSKTFRQNLNRLDLKNGDPAAVPDYEYTQSVLKTCFRILKKAISLVYIFDVERQSLWRVLRTELMDLEKQILTI